MTPSDLVALVALVARLRARDAYGTPYFKEGAEAANVIEQIQKELTAHKKLLAEIADAFAPSLEAYDPCYISVELTRKLIEAVYGL